MPPLFCRSAEQRLLWASALALLLLVGTAVVLSERAAADGGDGAAAPTTANGLPPLLPLSGPAWAGFGAAVVGLAVAAAGGIGGGGILLPVYTLLLRLPVHTAIPLTAATVLGSAAANNLVNAPRRHPLYPSRPCIDWDAILLLEPMTMAGALLGALLNTLLRPQLLVLLLLLLLATTSYLTFQKAVKLHDKETQQRAAAAAATATSGDAERAKLLAVPPGPGTGAYGTTPRELDHQETPNAAENAHEMWVDALKLTALFAVVTIINLLKGGGGGGGDGTPTAGACGPACFWTSNGIILLLIVAFVAWARRGLLHRLAAGGAVVSDIAWDGANTVRYPLYAVLAGLMAGLFGIGGGMVKGPLLLALGLHPAVVSATSACMILYTSATATVSFWVLGRLPGDYAAAGLGLGFVAALTGQSALALLLKKYQRHSYIAFAIAAVIAVSAVSMTVQSVLALRGG